MLGQLILLAVVIVLTMSFVFTHSNYIDEVIETGSVLSTREKIDKEIIIKSFPCDGKSTSVVYIHFTAKLLKLLIFYFKLKGAKLNGLEMDFVMIATTMKSVILMEEIVVACLSRKTFVSIVSALVSLKILIQIVFLVICNKTFF